MEEEILQSYLKAGKIASQVRREGAAKLKPGVSFREVKDFCEKRILELNGGIAWAQLAVNDQAAHYCPDDDDNSVAKEGDVIKVDVGVHINGYIADNAMTIALTQEYNDLIKTAIFSVRSVQKMSNQLLSITRIDQSHVIVEKKTILRPQFSGG